MTPHVTAVIRHAAAVLLDHPGPRLYGRLDLVGDALSEIAADAPAAADLDVLRRDLADTPPGAAAVRYSELFDLRRRSTLNLTWYTDGDTRRRGPHLAAIKRAVIDAGWNVDGGELPDHLGALAEFAAVEPVVGHEILCGLRASVDLLRAALADAGSVYVHAVTAVLATLPPATDATEERWRRLARVGPPTEAVGLDGYGGPTPLGVPTVRDGLRVAASGLGRSTSEDLRASSPPAPPRRRFFRQARASRREETP